MLHYLKVAAQRGEARFKPARAILSISFAVNVLPQSYSAGTAAEKT
jgi:hypothetical protein